MTRRLCAVLVLLAPFAAAPTSVRTAVNVTPASVTAARGTKATRIPRPRLSAVASPAAVRPLSGRGVSAHRTPRTGVVPPRPAHTSRSYTRPPIAEETRWRSTSARLSGRSVGSTPSLGTAKSARPRSRIPTPPMSDLQRALALPEPWRSIVRCESLDDGSWRVNSSSTARGFWQFMPSTWRSLGLHGDPATASFDEQYAAARRLARRDGLRAWDCARLLGLA